MALDSVPTLWLMVVNFGSHCVRSLSWLTADQPSDRASMSFGMLNSTDFYCSSIGKAVISEHQNLLTQTQTQISLWSIHQRAPIPPLGRWLRWAKVKLTSTLVESRRIEHSEVQSFFSELNERLSPEWKYLFIIYFLSVNTIRHIKVDICFSSSNREKNTQKRRDRMISKYWSLFL